jgi:hypothetical protein
MCLRLLNLFSGGTTQAAAAAAAAHCTRWEEWQQQPAGEKESACSMRVTFVVLVPTHHPLLMCACPPTHTPFVCSPQGRCVANSNTLHRVKELVESPLPEVNAKLV